MTNNEGCKAESAVKPCHVMDSIVELRLGLIVEGVAKPSYVTSFVTYGFLLTAHSVTTGREVPEIRCSDRELRLTEPEVSAAMCTSNARDQIACRILIAANDDSIHLMQQGGRVVWSREEALANVVAAEFVDLPVSELDAAIESEFDQKEVNTSGQDIAIYHRDSRTNRPEEAAPNGP